MIAELEMALVEGRFGAARLPDAWRDAYQRYLGITPTDDKDGVLQDVHWYAIGIGGYFQSYTLGNILSAQFLRRCRRRTSRNFGRNQHGQCTTCTASCASTSTNTAQVRTGRIHPTYLRRPHHILAYTCATCAPNHSALYHLDNV